MLNFTYYNPTRIIFGKGTIAELDKLVPQDNQGPAALRRRLHQAQRGLRPGPPRPGRAMPWSNMGGIEPNPHYETCLEALATARTEKVDFLLAVGGGSVIDAAKFIAAAAALLGTGALGSCCATGRRSAPLCRRAPCSPSPAPARK